MLGGGIPDGYSVLLAGPSGSGKSVLATQFIDGARRDEPGIIAVFEKRPSEYTEPGPSGLRFDELPCANAKWASSTAPAGSLHR